MQLDYVPPFNPWIKSTGSTTPRKLQDRFAEVVNVKDFGALGDGSTDDFASVNAAVATMSTGDVLFFPPSATEYMFSARITGVPSGCSIFAYPGSATVKPTAGNTSNALLFQFTAKDGITIYGLTIDGGGQDFGSANPVVTVFNSTHVVMDSVTMQNTRGLAFNCSNVAYCGVRNSRFINIGNRWKTTLVSTDRKQATSFCCTGSRTNEYNFVTGTYFEDVGLDSISTGDQVNFLAANNRFNMFNNQVNLLSASAYGGAIYGVGDTSITACDNIIDGCGGNGIDLDDNDHVVVTGNYVIGCWQAGIGVFGGSTAVVSNNIVLNSGKWSSNVYKGGISFSDDNGQVTVSGNICTDTQVTKTQEYGIFGRPSVSTATFTDLFIDANNMFDGNLTAQFGGNVTSYTYRNTERIRRLMLVP